MNRAVTVEVHVTPTKDYIIGVASFTCNNNNINTLKTNITVYVSLYNHAALSTILHSVL